MNLSSDLQEKILVVDNESEIVNVIESTLGDEGYKVFCYSSIPDAFKCISENNIDLLIIGMVIPEFNISEVLQRMRLINPSIGLIVISKDEPMDILIKSFQSGAQAVVLKPIQAQDLLGIVSEVLNKNRLAKENVRLKTLMPLFEVNKSIVSELSATKIFNRIVRIVCIETKADRVSLMLLDELSNELVVKAALGLSKAMLGKNLDLPQNDISWSVIKTGKAILLNAKPKNKDTMSKDSAVFISALCVPLSIKGKVIGVINCSKKASRVPFADSDLEFLTILAGQASIAIENAKLFEDIKTHKDNTEVFLRRCLTAQEDERRRISTELHDGLAQWLVSASYFIQLSNTFVSMSKLGEARSEISRAGTILDQSIKELRRVILDLHPTVLAEFGLIGALQQHIGSLGRETGIFVNFGISGKTVKLSSIQETTVYHVCLEALNNARRHANASNISVNIIFASDCLVLEVVDTGKGFNCDEVRARGVMNGNIGLLGMKDRAGIAGGRIDISSTIGNGTKVILTIPLAVESAIRTQIKAGIK